ncbi:helix-turn-helix domain-containing protein [Congregibacter sp.]|uniref:helix-turn-helix domain-containing protein n=1 Tax=Congregibacter sp. TaxID=2744308 RepID=UPI003F6C231F
MTNESRNSADNDGDPAGDRSESGFDTPRSSLIDTLIKRAGKVAGGTLDLAVDVATMSAMFGDSWVRDLLLNGASPERLEAMAEAGHFLRDARETAGLTISELSESLELSDEAVLAGVERGESILPLEVMLRTASLLARHDPVPFLIKFLRSYNPQLEATLEQWGVMALPRNFERERRFVNLYRQHDFLRDLDDEGYQRFVEYMDSSTQLVVDVMQREAAVKKAPRRAATRKSKPKSRPAAKRRATKSRAKTSPKSASPASAPAKPVVRKVKPRNSDS